MMKTSDFILSPYYSPINLHPMFTLRYWKSRDNLSSSDVKLFFENENKNSLFVNWVDINTEKTEKHRKSTKHMLLIKNEGKCSCGRQEYRPARRGGWSGWVEG